MSAHRASTALLFFFVAKNRNTASSVRLLRPVATSSAWHTLRSRTAMACSERSCSGITLILTETWSSSAGSSALILPAGRYNKSPGFHEILLELWLLLSFERETVLPAERNLAILTIVALETSDSHGDAHTEYINSGLPALVPPILTRSPAPLLTTFPYCEHHHLKRVCPS